MSLGSYSKCVEGNMDNLSPTIPINISRVLGKVENIYIRSDCSPNEVREYTKLFKEFCDVFTWLYEGIMGIEPYIVEHENKTQSDAKPIRQHLCTMNPRKATTIKAKVEKFLKVGFIYLIPLMKWMSNPFLVDKK